MKNILKTFILTTTAILTIGISSFAAEYSVQPVDFVLYTNENTIIFADADVSSQIVLPTVSSDLPIVVTGITTNGFYQIMLDTTYYIPANGLTTPEPKPEPEVTVKKDELDGIEQYRIDELNLINEHRRANGLAELSLDPKLCELADKRADEITINYEHTRPDGRSCFSIWDDYGYNGNCWRGENIAAGYPTVESVVDAWMNSPGHRANILKPEYTQIGIGYCRVPLGYSSYWVQLFSSQKIQ